jgi:vitamin-K-epoxide reductase (warfarin-sensitive)
MIIELISLIGLLISIYGFYVQRKKNKNSSYKAVCDINNKFNCSNSLTGEYSKHFGIPNTVYGMFFYTILFILSFLEFPLLIFGLSTIAFLGSFYLAYILYFKVKDVCLVCNAIYLTNLLLFVFSFRII